MRGIQGKTILVTGGTGLIGGSTCIRLAEEGAHVLVASRSFDRARQWVDAHADAGPMTPIKLDVSSADSIKAAFDTMRSGSMWPHGLIATAIDTRWHAIPFEQLSHEHFAKIGEADVAGNFIVARSLVDGLADDEPAAIVLLSSIYGSAGVYHPIYPEGMMHSPAHYAATKAAVQGVTRWLAAYWGGRGIRVNAVVSGGIRDENRQGDEFVERYNARVMLGRMGRPDEIASACAYLVSDDASYITGTCLDVEGGLLAW
jgi:NAD(P)-dependent dehydrogenase (short-subunit alcohol dehydrogenase family)